MEKVDGIILIISCKKYKNSRLNEFGPKKNIYGKWKVIKVIGNYFLNKEYELKKDILYVKCEDTYLHLLKKLSLSIKYLYKIFNIEQGILRCGDDLIFNESILESFLKSKKYDFYGQAASKKENYTSNNLDLLKNNIYDPFMLDYYKNHKNELFDESNGMNLTLDELNKYMIRPNIWGPSGAMYYISNYSCSVIINTMEKINYNIFHFDKFSNSYPYIIEDVGITYIMYYNLIPFINTQNLFQKKKNNKNNCIVKHTNKYK